jgi:hypothetical protein
MIPSKTFQLSSLVLGLLTLPPLLASLAAAPALDEPEEGAMVEEITRAQQQRVPGFSRATYSSPGHRVTGTTAPFDLLSISICSKSGRRHAAR